MTTYAVLTTEVAASLTLVVDGEVLDRVVDWDDIVKHAESAHDTYGGAVLAAKMAPEGTGDRYIADSDGGVVLIEV